MAFHVFVDQLTDTVTVSAAPAHPHRVTLVCCWSTMCEPMTAGRRTAAASGPAHRPRAAKKRSSRFMTGRGVGIRRIEGMSDGSPARDLRQVGNPSPESGPQSVSAPSRTACPSTLTNEPVPSHRSPAIGLLETILPTHRRHPTWVGLSPEVNKTLDSAGAGSPKRCKWSRP